MANRLIIFEDNGFADFYPITLSRPVFTLRCGMSVLWEKIARQFDEYNIAFSCRPEHAEILKEEFRIQDKNGYEVNQIDYQSGDKLVYINGRLRLEPEFAEELKKASDNRIYHIGNVTAAMVIAEPLQKSPEDIQFTGEGASEALGIKADMIPGEFRFYNYLWDLIGSNNDEIVRDYKAAFDHIDFARMLDEARIDSSARILSDANIYIGRGAEVGASAVIDNRSVTKVIDGKEVIIERPVIIDEGAVIGPLSFIEGPCYIGKKTQIYRGNIRDGCSFGPECRVGGEVEESIFQEYVNKYHDGFMGHAYVGGWVNLGALTTNSDLKNNFKNIRVRVNGHDVDTGYYKVGSFIGEYTKTGIGTLINTGVSIGFSCNIYGGNLVTTQEVPSFSWGDEKGFDPYRLDKAIETAKITMGRRERELTGHHEALFEKIFELTKKDR